jgi:hypothetical protein
MLGCNSTLSARFSYARLRICERSGMGEADSSAALRNDNQKSKGNGNGAGKIL